MFLRRSKVILGSEVRLVWQYKVIPKDFLLKWWGVGVVERAVLPWNHGRTSGSTICRGRDVFLVRDVLPLNHGRTGCSTNCWGSIVFNLAALPWNYGRTGGSTNFLG